MVFPVKGGQMLVGVHIYDVWRLYGGLYVTQHIQEGENGSKDSRWSRIDSPRGTENTQIKEKTVLIEKGHEMCLGST